MEAEVSKLLLNKVSYEEIAHLYPAIYQEVFGEYAWGHAPAFVYLCFYGTEYMGFISGYNHDIYTLYIQYAGYIDKWKGKASALRILKDALKELHKEYKFILTMIRNDNSPALRLTLAAGFEIIGTRQDTDKNLYVEFIKGG